jgi:glycosyltransferase involved in cell wall biosynthesis
MKIAFVYDVIYPYVKGGVEKRVWELAQRLSARGHEVHLFGMKFWDGDDILVRERVILHGVCPSQKLYVRGRRSLLQPLCFSINLILPLLREKFDIIDCQQFPYLSCFSVKFISKAKKIPLVITWHEIWGNYWYEYLGWKGFAGKCTERLVARLTSNNIAVSKTTKKNLEILGISWKINIIPNGVDFQKIRSIPPSDSISEIIFAGRLIREKHIDLLIQAFCELLFDQPALRLLIIGEGPEKDSIVKQINGYSIENQVQLMGFQENHDEIIARMKSSKICVLPSTREGFGITALEALACGLPVVTIDHPANAIRDLINENNGFLCSLTTEGLGDAICLALRHYEDMQKSCILSAKSFDWELIILDIEGFYRSVIANYAFRK